jgi:hypothetical protein
MKERGSHGVRAEWATIMCGYIALLSCSAEKPHALAAVTGHAVAVRVHHAEVVLGLHVALRCRATKQIESSCPVPGNSTRTPVVPASTQTRSRDGI